jgi:signal transduction histidine kinase
MLAEAKCLTAAQCLPEHVSLCFYRVAQDALIHAVKHSQSSKVDASVVSNGRVLSTRIRDFGDGFDPAVPREGLGLVTMQERLRLIGGVLRFNALPGGGTELQAEVNSEVATLPAQAA